MSKPFFVKLPDRGLIHIEGEERVKFLQNLVTNDIEALSAAQSVYACLLTPQGKFLHDFFVRDGGDVLLLDCEGGTRAQDLYKRLNMYRLRSKIALSVEDHHDVYAVLPPSIPPASGGDVRGGCAPDPRHPDMGWRTFEKPEGIEEKPFSEWDTRRLHLAIPDGSRDMVPEQSTMLESNIDKLHGISFEKGCYIGQEVTARMHYRGLAKKHLYALEGKNAPLPESGTEIHINGKRMGEMRSSCGTAGLALLKDAALKDKDSLPFDIKIT